jgi:signal peptidase I
MMRIVYDNDHPPKDLEGIVPPRWAGASDQWKADNNHGFTAAASDDKEHWLRYRHYVRDWRDLGEQKKYNHQLISDFMGYNSGYNNFRNEHDSSNGRNWVGDLILETEVTVNQAQGELVFELSKANDRFQARLNLVDGLCRMVRLTETESDPTVTTRELEKQKTSVRKGTYNIRFANVDNRLLLWIDGKLIFPDGVNYDAPLTPIATKKNDLDRPASIAVKGADVQVRHMKLFRDTYYTTNDKDERYPLDNPESWKEMARDKDKDRRPLLTLYVQPDHFLCMGDNSPQSSDSRTWGLVPRRLLLGRALAVYYPFYFPFWPLSSQVNRVGLIH